MNRVKFLLVAVAALAVMLFCGIGCNGDGSPVLGDTEQTKGESPLPTDSSDNAKTLAGTRWKLIEVSIIENSNYPAEIIDYSEKNIIYEFQGNDKLVITGKTDSLFIFDYFKNGEHFYEYRGELVGCPLCLPGPNLSIDMPPLGQSDGNYFALLNGEKLEIVGDTYIGGVKHENGLIEGATHYHWGKTFIKLK